MTDPISPVVVGLTAVPVLSYAMAHNRIPVLDRLWLRSDTDRQAVVVRLSVRDSQGVLTAPYERVVGQLRAR